MIKNFNLIKNLQIQTDQKKYKNESGQALLGGLFFLILTTSLSVYFIFVSTSINKLYSNTLKTRFDTISVATKYANILNEISINNQNIIVSLMTTQIAYISAIETGLTVSYTQPYWETYSNIQTQNNTYKLSNTSLSAINKSFESYALTTARGFYLAKALSIKNQELVQKLPDTIKKFFTQSTNAFAHCLALEFQNTDLYVSHYAHFLVPSVYQLGVTKKNCTLQHKNNFLQKILNKGLPTLITQDSDFIISFNKIDTYFTADLAYLYGITYVKSEFLNEFIQSLKFIGMGTLKSVIRISHPDFFCQNKHFFEGDFVVEDDWHKVCDISKKYFFKAFFKPHWAALVTSQEKNLKYQNL